MDKIGNYITDILQIPPETMSGVPRVTVSGNRVVIIENHKGLRVYNRECVEVNGKNSIVRVSGTELEIVAMTKTELIVHGIIVLTELC